MTKAAEDRAKAQKYLARFGVTALLLVAGTLVLVLYVLPERYVLDSGFRESGLNFPSEAAPFVPVPVVRVATTTEGPVARHGGVPTSVPVPLPVLAGPSRTEVFWAEVVPLLRAGSDEEALEVFRRYLDERPGDLDARREYAVALLATGRWAPAVPELRAYLTARDDPSQRRLLARTLRDLGRIDEASDEYRTLLAGRRDDADLRLEWARALYWAAHHDEATEVLGEGLRRQPDSAPLRVALARVHFAADRVPEAAAVLAPVSREQLAALDATALADAIASAMYVPAPAPPPPPTLAERAAMARGDGHLAESAELYRTALLERPDEAATWLAYANLLEYEQNDLEGARLALLEVERLGAADIDLQYRIARVEVWLGMNDRARVRLLGVLATLDREADRDEAPPADTGEAAVGRADVLALLADLDRWSGRRLEAAARYVTALFESPEHPRALEGLARLEADVRGEILELERPGLRGSAYASGDTDDFSRADLAAEWVGVSGRWVWGVAAGNRWLGGFDLGGGQTSRDGLYAEAEGARWWRWGTVRTGFESGVQRVRDTWDYSLGASLRHRGAGDTQLHLEHGPAYPIATTLQSFLAETVQDRVTLAHTRRLSERWSVSVQTEVAVLGTTSDSPVVTGPESTTRASATVSVGRAISRELTLGVMANALGYTRAAPTATDSVATFDRSLFWDPSFATSAGPYAMAGRDLDGGWRLSGRLSTGLALIDERRSAGLDLLPVVSVEGGVRHEGDRYWTALDAFASQSRFDGYRSYGLRLTFGTASRTSSTGLTP